jgi:tRNA-binding EMAP/Myf-like protein
MTITYDDFAKVDIRIGTVRTAQPLEGARKPAFRLEIDFGSEVGVKNSSAQLTAITRPRNSSASRSRPSSIFRRAKSASSCRKF